MGYASAAGLPVLVVQAGAAVATLIPTELILCWAVYTHDSCPCSSPGGP
jgi:hypothetical protein